MRTLTRNDWRQWAIFAIASIAVAIGLCGAAGEAAYREAQVTALEGARTATALHTAVLRSELQRHRFLPSVLARNPDIATLLATPEGARVDAMNDRFEALSRETQAAVIYVLDAQGLARSASNWRSGTSFVGSNFRHRPYFFEAMRDGQSFFFALGSVSGRPGLFLSRRIDDERGLPLGVVVAKVEFDALEADWRASGEPTYVTDRTGRIVLTTVPAWRFRQLPADKVAVTRVVSAGVGAVAGAVDLPPAPTGEGFVRLENGNTGGIHAYASDRIPDVGWTLHLLAPAGAELTGARTSAQIVTLLSLALASGLAGVLLRRRQRSVARAAEFRASRQALEDEIALRTGELRSANERLSREVEEKLRIETSRQELLDDLIQSSKLATLGQIAAGVAHEINQPIATIRTYADTASLYLRQGDDDAVERSLAHISDLTVRVGSITDELRDFSRKTKSASVAVGLEAAIDGALLLVGPRLREHGIVVTRRPMSPDLKVVAERNRLEQVFLNLLQNAIEALGGAADPVIRITVRQNRSRVTVTVADNGPGVACDIRDRLFTPFTTNKAHGLGLGLVISRDIVAGFGGQLSLGRTRTGAAFNVRLEAAG